MGHKVPAIERFLLRVKKCDSSCWEWTAFKTKDGYGKFCLAKNKYVSAHRFSYGYFVGDIAEGLEIDHTCSSRACVNPAHLEAVTHKENVRRGVERGGYRNNGQKLAEAKRSLTQCPSGHPYSGDNLTIDKGTNGRRCKICNNAKTKRYLMRKANDKA